MCGYVSAWISGSGLHLRVSLLVCLCPRSFTSRSKTAPSVTLKCSMAVSPSTSTGFTGSCLVRKTHTHTHTHNSTQAHTQARAHVHTHEYTRRHASCCIHTRTHIHARTHVHSHKHTRQYTFKQARTHIHTSTHAHSHKHARTFTQARTHARTFTQARGFAHFVTIIIAVAAPYRLRTARADSAAGHQHPQHPAAHIPIATRTGQDYACMLALPLTRTPPTGSGTGTYT